MIPTFAERREQWSNPPVDDVGYLPSADLLKLPDERLMLIVAQAERARYGGWRNYQNRWRKTLCMNTTHDKLVLDYGCGIGIEALQYARAGNDVVLADISRSNLRLAERVLRLHGFKASSFLIVESARVELASVFFGQFDVIHCAGVLHHIPEPEPVVKEMAAALTDDGELRLMVYSYEAWRIACGTEPPEYVEDDPGFERYWTRWDSVGGYADWYDAARLERRFGEWFELIDCQYLTEHGEYLGAVLRKR